MYPNEINGMYSLWSLGEKTNFIWHVLFCSVQICLNVVGKGDALSSFDGIFDLPEQELLRNDCKEFIGELN